MSVWEWVLAFVLYTLVALLMAGLSSLVDGDKLRGFKIGACIWVPTMWILLAVLFAVSNLYLDS